MSFRVGQRVRVNSPGNQLHGAETVILRLDVAGIDMGGSYVGAELDYSVRRFLSETGLPVYEYRELIPLDDTYDGNAVTTWAHCQWKPQSVRA